MKRCANLLGTRCSIKMKIAARGTAAYIYGEACECSLKEGQWECCKEYKEITLEQRVEELESIIMARKTSSQCTYGEGVHHTYTLKPNHTHWWKS